MKYNNYLLSNNSEYFSIIKNAVNSIERQYPVKVLFSGITNSIPAGLNNKNSDIDLFVVYHSLIPLQKDVTTLFNTALLRDGIEIKMTPLSVIFPDTETLLYKSDLAWGRLRRLWDYNELPGQENIEQTTLFTQILFGKMVLDNDNYFFSHNCVIKNENLNVYDFLKRCYVWAKGRLDNYLIEGYVRVRTYLYAVYEVLLIDIILTCKNLPDPSFLNIIGNLEDTRLRQSILDLYDVNKTTVENKDNTITKKDELLNNWLKDCLDTQKRLLINFYNYSRYITFDLFKK